MTLAGHELAALPAQRFQAFALRNQGDGCGLGDQAFNHPYRDRHLMNQAQNGTYCAYRLDSASASSSLIFPVSRAAEMIW
jgi:hypothetical protein